MTVDQINVGYVFTLFISSAAIVSGVAILLMASKNGHHFFKERGWAYFALMASITINIFFLYNILLWLSSRYVEIQDIDFHVRWLIYHTCEKMAIFMFHHDLYRRVIKWRASYANS